VLDITIAYPDGKPIGLDDIVTGLRDPCQTNFFYKLYHSSQVSRGEVFIDYRKSNKESF
jgi:lysophosphatidylglycerol acyltransferase 1